MTTVTLPWPPKNLSPNNRGHWSKRAAANKAYKEACWGILLASRELLKGVSRFSITFRRPDRRKMDMDNAISCFKSGQDALAIVTGVNDRHFVMTYAFGEPVKGGAVIVEVTG